MKRIFVGVKTNSEIDKQAQLFAERFSNIPARWISPKNLHITLVPPWRTDDVAGVVSKLKSIKSDSFTYTIDQVSYGPNSKSPRLIWASGRTPKELLDLKNKVSDALEKGNDRFLLHITLARFKPDNFSSFSIKSLDEKVDWEGEASEFVLFESVLSPGGAEYEILERFPLD